METCLVDSCDRIVKTRGYCSPHYSRVRKYGDPLSGGPRRNRAYREPAVCTVDGCEKMQQATGLCAAHYRRMTVHGSVDTDNRRKASTCAIEGCSGRHVGRGYCGTHYRRLRLYGDPEGVPLDSRRGEASGRQVDRKGYVQYYWPEHPNARADGKIAEHSMVMSASLGRALLPAENVHHRNGVRDDNRIENLELWTKFQPPGKRVRDLIEYANEIHALYGTDPSFYP